MSSPVELGPVDRRLLQLLQDDFPLTARPWAVLGEELGLAEAEVLARVRRLARAGIVRSIGPVVEARRVGLNASTLVALRVPGERLREVAAIIGEHPGVSHCYERYHEYNLWFTLAMPDQAGLDREVRRLLARSRLPPEAMLDLPVRRRFKVDVRYRVADPGPGGERA